MFFRFNFFSPKIDLVLGDGKVVFDDTQLDSIPNNEMPTDTIPNEQ